MLDGLENGLGLDIVLWFQSLRFGLLDFIVNILDFAGGEIFFIIIFGVVYWTFDKRFGIRMFMALITITLITSFFKDILGRARPYQIAPELITPLFEESSYGIPSGHVTMSLVVWGYLAWWMRRTVVTVAVVVYITMQALSRMIAGVHYPQDVVFGLIIGVLVLILYIRLSERFAVVWSSWSPRIQVAFTVIVSLLLSAVVMLTSSNPLRWEDYLTTTGLLLGTGLAVVFEHRYVNFTAHPDVMRQIIQYCLGIAVTVALLLSLDIVFDAIAETGYLAGILRVLRYAAVAFMALGLWTYFSVQARLLQTETVTVVSSTK
jgi:membrane-associated phospholipid phosphatase